jgi:WD40 repeat protein
MAATLSRGGESESPTAVLWETASGSKLQSFKGHTQAIVGVAFAAGSKQVWTGYQDGTTRLWDASSGKELCTLLSLEAGKGWLVIAPDCSFDGSEGAWKHLAFRVPGETTFLADPDGAIKKSLHPPACSLLMSKPSDPNLDCSLSDWALVSVLKNHDSEIRAIIPSNSPFFRAQQQTSN